MSNELIINSTQDGCRLALLKDKSLVEFHHDNEENKFSTVKDFYDKNQNGTWDDSIAKPDGSLYWLDHDNDGEIDEGEEYKYRYVDSDVNDGTPPSRGYISGVFTSINPR